MTNQTEDQMLTLEPSGNGQSNDQMISSPKPKRIRWIDQARGFIIVYMVVFIFARDAWVKGNVVTAFLFAHPPSDATYMNLYDVGASSFIFILGLLYGYSFWRRRSTQGTGKAIWHILFRYGLILLLGIIIIFADAGELTAEKNLDEGGTITVIIWDVLPTLGLVGIVALPFVFFEPKIRMVLGYVLMSFYQIMLSIDATMWKIYAIKSVHGGIYGTIFSFSANLIIASALGQLLFEGLKTDKKKTYTNWTIFSVANLVAGLVLQFIPTMEASKRQVSLTYTLISMGLTGVGIILFILLDEKWNKNSIILDAYGKNPFLIYILAIIPEFILYDIILDEPALWIEVVIMVVFLTLITLIALLMYKKAKVLSTERVALVTIIIVVILAVILIATGII